MATHDLLFRCGSTLFSRLLAALPLRLVSLNLFVGEPRHAAVLAQTRWPFLKAVGLHQSRQPGIVRLVTFGTWKRMLLVVSPSLYRPVDQTGLGLTDELLLGVAIQANTSKDLVIFRYPVIANEGIPVNVVLHALHRLAWCSAETFSKIGAGVAIRGGYGIKITSMRSSAGTFTEIGAGLAIDGIKVTLARSSAVAFAKVGSGLTVYGIEVTFTGSSAGAFTEISAGLAIDGVEVTFTGSSAVAFAKVGTSLAIDGIEVTFTRLRWNLYRN